MRTCLIVLAVSGAFAAAPAADRSADHRAEAQADAKERVPPPMVKPPIVSLTRGTFVIPDPDVVLVPNIGVVVGREATLVIDTGMGPGNGRTVLREVARVSTNRKLYLTATHYHSEHVSGMAAFPPSTIFVASKALQDDLNESGARMFAGMSRLSPLIGELLKDAPVRRADIVFEREHELDLGGVKVKLIAVGPTHTRGDTVVFVEGDRVLFAGDVVLNRRFLSFSDQSKADAWFVALDRLEALRPRTIVPSHGPMGDMKIIGQQRTMLAAIRTRVHDLKKQGRSLEDTSRTVDIEFQATHPDWKATLPNELPPIVKALYAE